MRRFFDVKFYYGINLAQCVEVENVEASSPDQALELTLKEKGFSENDHFPLRREQPMSRHGEDGEACGLFSVWSAGLTISGQRAWIYEQIGS
jgi:hypothetical protein